MSRTRRRNFSRISRGPRVLEINFLLEKSGKRFKNVREIVRHEMARVSEIVEDIFNVSS